MISPTVCDSRLKVAVSITLSPKRTCARRNLRPIRKQLRNARFTSFGLALVPTSKSFGCRPQEAVAERALHLVRLGAGAHVEVLRLPPQEEVADAAADQIRLVSEAGETVQHA